MDQTKFSFREFRLLFLSRSLAAMALQAQAVIVGWQVYQIHPDALLLGFLGLTEAIPAITCSFFSGHLVDSHRPALIYRLSLIAMFLNSCLLFIASTEWFGDHHRLFILFAGIFISGAARSFSSPAVFSMVPQLVPREWLGRAAAWNSSAFQFASILGPAFGGLIYGFGGSSTAFLFPIGLLLLSVGSTFLFVERTQNLRSPFAREPFWQSLQAGVNFSLHHRVLLSAMLLDMFSVLFGGATALLPIFADQIFQTGSVGLGFLRAAPAIGSGAVAFMLAFRSPRFITGRRLLFVVAGFGISTIGFALSTNFIVAFFFLVLAGAFDGISMVIRSTILQLLTPENMRGRVSALSSIFITSSNEIGAFESGFAARLLGLVPSVVFGGIMTLLVVAGVTVASPELRKTKIDQNS